MTKFTILDAQNWALNQLKDTESPNIDIRVLLQYILKCDTTYLLTWSDKEISNQDFLAFQKLVNQRKIGIPIAYLTGRREFWELPLKVNNSTLIPRPDTECLVELVINFILENKIKDPKILDLGTGTGAIALALASEFPEAKITAIDFIPDAVKLAQNNAKELKIKNINIFQSNWFQAINKEEKFDLIVSNPPYIDENDGHLLVGDVRFEPNSALVAKNNGLSDIEIILKNAKNYLKNNGYIFIEHGYNQKNQVQAIFNKNNYNNIKSSKDYADNDRITYGSFIGE